MTGRLDTIIALASGAGRAGVAVIRISGPAAMTLLETLSGHTRPPPRVAQVRKLRTTAGVPLDEALVLGMPGPNSFTGEDVVEFHVHGGPAIVASVLQAAQSTGLCRIADPGEFTRRAFLNGKVDLTRAEAIADLVDAETEGQLRQAQRLYAGEAQRTFDAWRDDLLDAMASLEAAIDFPDEADVPADVALRALAPVEKLAKGLEQALSLSGRLEAVREGFRVAILGAPNAGKSSLLNRLARREAAIVSPIPGTTRDVVEVRVILNGYPVWIADTAGLRDASDAIEAEGVRRALERAENADLRVWVVDVSRETPPRPPSEAQPGDLLVLNKADLTSPEGVSRETWIPDGRLEVSAISALTGSGLEALETRLAEIVRDRLSTEEPPLVTRARHRELVEAALFHVKQALDGAKRGVAAELVSEDLRLAARALGRVTGTVDVEDLLDRIFAGFCIGK
jgi:tRNA modification GTPase